MKLKPIHYIPKGRELPVCGAIGFLAGTSKSNEVTCKECKEKA